MTTLANTMNLMDLATYTQRKGGTLPLVCVQCIEVALRYTASQQPSCFAAGRSLFFNNAATNYRLSGGSEVRYWLTRRQCTYQILRSLLIFAMASHTLNVCRSNVKNGALILAAMAWLSPICEALPTWSHP